MKKVKKYKIVLEYYENLVFAYCPEYLTISSFYDIDCSEGELIKNILRHMKENIKSQICSPEQRKKKQEYIILVSAKDKKEKIKNDKRKTTRRN